MKDIHTKPIQLKGPLAWMAKNSVAANILMLFLLIGGFMTTNSIKQEVFPAFEVEMINVSVVYPGASPKEIEEGILLALEESVRSIDGVKEISATANEGYASCSIEFNSDTDMSIALADVKNAVDSLSNLPENAETPNVSMVVPKREVINMVVYGQLDDFSKQELGKKIRDDLLQKKNITSVSLIGLKPLQISIEIPKKTLRKYNLTLSEISQKIKLSAHDLSSGSIQSDDGEILLRLKEQRRTGSSFYDIPIITTSDGTHITLGEIATITDGFNETDQEAYFNGEPSFQIKVSREGEQTPIEVSTEVRKYLDKLESELPAGVKVDIQRDRAENYRDRLNLLLKNALIGLVLVIVLLGIFLDIKLAFWVTMGIPISFLGTLLFMPSLDVSINMISLFAFIMALGMVIDDAIVVGENIFTMRNKGYNILTAAILGVREVAVPVTFAIITNIIAFMPLMFMGGVMGRIATNIPLVVITAFIISLIEALIILPAHLGHSKKSTKGIFGLLSKYQNKLSKIIEKLIKNVYRPILRFALKNRYATTAFSIALLVIIVSYIMSGRVRLTFNPETEADDVNCSIVLPYGSPLGETIKVQEKIVKEAKKLLEKLGGKTIYEGIFTSVGSVEDRHFGSGKKSSNIAKVEIYFVGVSERNFELKDFVKVWRKNVGEIPGVETLTFATRKMGPGGGSAIHFRLTHNESETAELAATELAEILRNYPSVKDIDDGLVQGKPQLDIKLTPEAYTLNLTPSIVSSQLRASFYGSEALRFQRGRDEVKVMVLLPGKEREQEKTMEEFLVKTPAGGEIPLKEAIEIDSGYAYTIIERVNGRRIINVTADCEPRSLSSQISADLMAGPAEELKDKFQGLSFIVGGMEQERQESMNTLVNGFILAFLATFGLLAIVFRSYIQPLIIMVAIPFGIIGAVMGHIIMGFNISLMSFMGIVALSGIVINDSLVLVDFANRQRRSKTNCEAFEAVTTAGTQRFRPVILTTLTTFLGLTPMIFETSPQAKMLIPMAISLGFGEIFSTMIILLLVPSIYLIIEDITRAFKYITFTKEKTEDADNTEPSPENKLS
ncbi:MAG: efflux RND transporter permease subunit [Planctomycetes bacterium]|nr:efflux RND transporter permease subunit [Planctomycetota bacterium]